MDNNKNINNYSIFNSDKIKSNNNQNNNQINNQNNNNQNNLKYSQNNNNINKNLIPQTNNIINNNFKNPPPFSPNIFQNNNYNPYNYYTQSIDQNQTQYQYQFNNLPNNINNNILRTDFLVVNNNNNSNLNNNNNNNMNLNTNIIHSNSNRYGEWVSWNSKEFLNCSRFHNLVYYRIGNLKFLSETLAEQEPWGKELKVLKIYVDNTFKRVVEENKLIAFIPFNQKIPSLILFNTGLLSKNYEEIFCVLQNIKLASQKDRELEFGGRKCEERQWILKQFIPFSSFNDHQIFHKYNKQIPSIQFSILPKRPNYYLKIHSPKYYSFDPNVEIETTSINFIDILKNAEKSKIDRLPLEYIYCSADELNSRFHKNIGCTVNRLKSNPRCGVPQFHRDSDGTSSIDLLVPIFMGKSDW
ncbi:hypothetical protein ACTFIR_003285 [Dictyostelium discoideum]